MKEQPTRFIIIGGVEYILIRFFDEYGEDTSDPTEAVKVLVQRPEDVRPEGIDQTFNWFEVPKGTFVEATLQ